MSEPLTELIGRDASLERAQELLAEGTRWLTVSGPVGVGKSRFLAAVAASVTPSEAPGGIWLSSLAGATTETAVCARVAASLPNVDALALPQSGDALGAALHALDAVLVLDDAEHAVPILSRWLPNWLARSPRLRCLVGTRERLGGAGEVILRLEPLHADDAARLFEARAEHSRGAPLRAAEKPLVREVVDLLDRLPLALELAAAQLAALGTTDLLGSLQGHALRLASPDRAADARHESLEAALDLSWELLDDSRREALAVLALFESAPDLTDFSAVLASEVAPTVLAALRDRSWLQIDPVEGGHRYRLLRVVRAYVRERARTDPTRRSRYVAHVEARATELLGAWGDRESTLALSRLAVDVSAAMNAAPARGTLAMKLGVVLAQVALARGPVPETLARLDELLHGHEAASEVLVDALLARGRLRARVAQPEQSRLDYERALTLAEALGDRSREARAATSLADHWRHHGDSDRSETFYRQALERAEDLALRARITASLAGLTAERGDLDDAETLYGQAVASSRAAGDVLAEAAALQNLGLLLQERGQLDRAEALTREALELHLPLRQRRFEAIAHLDLAALALERARPLEARGEAELAVRLAAEAGDQREHALAQMLLGVALASLDELDSAEVAFARANALAEPLQEPGSSSALAIHSGHLELARARNGGQGVGAAREALETPAEGDDARMARRVLASAIERAERSSAEARVALDGSRVVLPSGEALDLSGRSSLHGIVAALAASLRGDPGASLSAADMVAAGWPGRRSQTKAAMNRLHVALATLRKLGLAPHLERSDEGYRLVACRVDALRED